ncbi:MAG: sodium:solute symporter [Phycisphaerales bacterium]|nr:sodium:solute symporter [Phycisphaerales bacterium]
MQETPETSQLAAGFSPLDWTVLCAYFLVLIITGWIFARKERKDTEDYFLGGRKIPAWAVAISIVATSLSAATFIGVPELSYTGNLTYLATNIGMILAALVIAFMFIPRFYQTKSASIYELLERRMGSGARRAASVSFLFGRVLASGARVFAAAIPLSMVIFGIDAGLEPLSLMISISALTVVAIGYTLWGGIASVIWSDVLQYAVLVGAACVAIALIAGSINAPLDVVLDSLNNPTSETGEPMGSKLKIFEWSPEGFDIRKPIDFAAPFAIPACFIGYTLLGIGSYGTDQDLAQRMLTCKDAKSGARSVLMGIFLGIPTVLLFLIVGLMLWIVYQRPDLTDSPIQRSSSEGDSLRIFLEYILTQIPSGVRGLMMAGLFAAGLSSMNSAINAMGAAFIADLYRPIFPNRSEQHYLKRGRVSVIIAGIVLGMFACICIYWKDANGYTLIDFALSVMGFAYAGLVGVFLTAILTKRGSSISAIAALIVGFLWMLASQPFMIGQVIDLTDSESTLASYAGIHHTWKLTLGVALSTTVCMLGKRRSQGASLHAP